jgi:hypothetical protein
MIDQKIISVINNALKTGGPAHAYILIAFSSHYQQFPIPILKHQAYPPKISISST